MLVYEYICDYMDCRSALRIKMIVIDGMNFKLMYYFV